MKVNYGRASKEKHQEEYREKTTYYLLEIEKILVYRLKGIIHSSLQGYVDEDGNRITFDLVHTEPLVRKVSIKLEHGEIYDELLKCGKWCVAGVRDGIIVDCYDAIKTLEIEEARNYAEIKHRLLTNGIDFSKTTSKILRIMFNMDNGRTP